MVKRYKMQKLYTKYKMMTMRCRMMKYSYSAA